MEDRVDLELALLQLMSYLSIRFSTILMVVKRYYDPSL